MSGFIMQTCFAVEAILRRAKLPDQPVEGVAPGKAIELVRSGSHCLNTGEGGPWLVPLHEGAPVPSDWYHINRADFSDAEWYLLLEEELTTQLCLASQIVPGRLGKCSP